MSAVRDFYHYRQVRDFSPISSKHNLNRGEAAPTGKPAPIGELFPSGLIKDVYIFAY